LPSWSSGENPQRPPTVSYVLMFMADNAQNSNLL
jgi:hypothetical protein